MHKIFWIALIVVTALGCRHTIRDGGHLTPPPYRTQEPAAVERTSNATSIERTDVLPDLGAPHSSSAEIPESRAPRDAARAVEEVNGQLADAFFDYDRAAVGPDALAALRQDAALLLPILAEFPQIKVVVEGHCDERGSAEYNLGLGDHRAGRAVEALQAFGMPLGNLEAISYGKERPQCTEETESCWRLNRRVHLVLRLPRATE